MSLSDKQILERTSPSVYFQFPGFATLGTNEMLGTDFTKTSWYNMGEESNNWYCRQLIVVPPSFQVNTSRISTLSCCPWTPYLTRSSPDLS